MSQGNTSLWKVHAALLVAQLLSGGYYVVTKVALVHGMNRIVLSLYRDVIALLILFPAALIIERYNPFKLSWRVVARLFLLGLIGIFGSQFLLFIGIERTTAEFSAALQTSVPVLTAGIAILLGVERLLLQRRDGRAKLAGITLCCAGAIFMTFYKGPPVLGWFNPNTLEAALEPDSIHVKLELYGSHWNWFEIDGWKLGAICLIGNCLCMAIFINLQASLLKQFPAPISVVAYSYFFGAIIMGSASYFLVHDSSAWILRWDIDLLAVLYNGIISSALYFALMTWALSKVGPVFVASYIPLQPISSALLALIFLKTIVYLGSVLGTLLIILGLLLVSWAREEAMRLAALSAIVERSNRLPKATAEALVPGLRAPLLQV